jgi:hypothetical protein
MVGPVNCGTRGGPATLCAPETRHPGQLRRWGVRGDAYTGSETGTVRCVPF